MSVGSHLAGQAIDVSKTTAAHALSYAITKKYGVDHGNAVALTLGVFIDRHLAAERSQLWPTVDADAYQSSLDLISSTLGIGSGESGRHKFTRLLQSICLPASLSEVGVQSDGELEQLVASVNVERLQNNPVRFDTSELIEVLRLAAQPVVS